MKQSLAEINYEPRLEDGTAIGMGLSTAVNRLKESTAKSKVIILLTDGVNNSGFIDPRIAAELASEYEIKTYTIGLGTNGRALAPVSILPNGDFQFSLTKVEIDEDLLRFISEKTSGRYFRATDNLDDFILLDVDLDWGLDIARIKRRITIILIIFKSGLILDTNDLFSFNKDKDDCFNVAWVNLPNLYQNNIATGIIIAINRYSGSAKYKSLNITILLLCQNSQEFLTQYH